MDAAEKGFTSNVALTITSATSSLTSDGEETEFLLPCNSWFPVAGPFGLHELNFTAGLPCSNAQPPYLYSYLDGNAPLVSSASHGQYQDTSRKTSGLLDTRKWSSSSSLVASHAVPQTQFPSVIMGSFASPASLDVVSNTFARSFAPVGTPAHWIASEPQAIVHPQARPDPSIDCPNPTTRHYAYLGTDPTSPTHGLPSSSSSPFSTEIAEFAGNGGQPSLVLNSTPENSGGRHCGQRACAINIDGVWMDRDDLYSVAGQGCSIISVHQCQWDGSGDPCGMWIIGSRACVGAHVRKWHRRMHGDSRVKCLWDGCTATAMLKDSISRHVVTVHLEEKFHCQGCNQEPFSRKDVYDKHVGNSEACRDAGVAVVYGTDRRMVDTRSAL